MRRNLISKPVVWHSCYERGWGKFLPSDAYAHPAKVAFGLAERIYAHLLACGYVKRGDLLLDPFTGIGGFAFHAMTTGLRFLGVELEPKFCGMANGWECPGTAGKLEWPMCCQCQKARSQAKGGHVGIPSHHAEGTLEFWRRRWGLTGATILQGDSRKLCELVGSALASCVVGSPPYSDQAMDPGEKSRSEAKIARLLREGKVHEAEIVRQHGSGAASNLRQQDYGTTPGQLGAMPAGSMDAILSSPPYAETLKGDGTQAETAEESRAKRRTEGGGLGQSQRTKGYGSAGNLGNLPAGSVEAVVSSPPWQGAHEGTTDSQSMRPPHDTPERLCQGYGPSPQNLGNLPAGEPPGADAVVGSPPWEGAEGSDDRVQKVGKATVHHGGDGKGGTLKPTGRAGGMGDSRANLNNTTGPTFWSAAREIVAQCHQILKPGGVCVWVLKPFVRNKALVDFPGQWRTLCHSVGFEFVEEIHASLVKERRDAGLFGEEVVKEKKRASFFRRLAESKGSPKIDFEVVLILKKGTP